MAKRTDSPGAAGQPKKRGRAKWGVLLCLGLFLLGTAGAYIAWDVLDILPTASTAGAGDWFDIPADADGGNRMGNSSFFWSKGGMIAAQDDWTFFANIEDGDKLYMANRTGGELKKLTDFAVAGINVAGDTMVFTDLSDTQLYRQEGGTVKTANFAAESFADIVAVAEPGDTVQPGGRLYVVGGLEALCGGDDSALDVQVYGNENYSVYQPMIVEGEIFYNLTYRYTDEAPGDGPPAVEGMSASGALPLAAGQVRPTVSKSDITFYTDGTGQVCMHIGKQEGDPIYITRAGQQSIPSLSVVAGDYLLMSATSQDGRESEIVIYNLKTKALHGSFPGSKVVGYKGTAIVQGNEDGYLYALNTEHMIFTPVSLGKVPYGAFGLTNRGELAYAFNDGHEFAILSKDKNRERFEGNLRISMKDGYYNYPGADEAAISGSNVLDSYIYNYVYDQAAKQWKHKDYQSYGGWDPIDWLRAKQPAALALPDAVPPIRAGELHAPKRDEDPLYQGAQNAAAQAAAATPGDDADLPKFDGDQHTPMYAIEALMLILQGEKPSGGKLGHLDMDDAYYTALYRYYGLEDSTALILAQIKDYGTAAHRKELAESFQKMYKVFRAKEWQINNTDVAGELSVVCTVERYMNWGWTHRGMDKTLKDFLENAETIAGRTFSEQERYENYHDTYLYFTSERNWYIGTYAPLATEFHFFFLKYESDLGWVMRTDKLELFSNVMLRGVKAKNTPPPPDPVEVTPTAAFEAFVAYMQGGDISHPKIAAAYPTQELFDVMAAYYGSPQEAFYTLIDVEKDFFYMHDTSQVPQLAAYYKDVYGLFTYEIEVEKKIGSTMTIQYGRRTWGDLGTILIDGKGYWLNATNRHMTPEQEDQTALEGARLVMTDTQKWSSRSIKTETSSIRFPFNAKLNTHETLGYVLQKDSAQHLAGFVMLNRSGLKLNGSFGK